MPLIITWDAFRNLKRSQLISLSKSHQRLTSLIQVSYSLYGTVERLLKIIKILTAYEHIKLDDLDIIGTLGIGGFGRVELAQYQKKETFALKKLKKQEVINQGQIQHAYCEKEIMSVCDSPFIVK